MRKIKSPRVGNCGKPIMIPVGKKDCINKRGKIKTSFI